MQGLVAKSTGKNYRIWLQNGDEVVATLKGGMRLNISKSTNPIAVGDNVEIEKSIYNDYLISKVQPRKNYIIRKSINLSKQTHVIAANIDLAVLVVSLIYPRTSSGFIDRFLVTAEAYQIKPLIVFNKVDLYGEIELAKEFISVYESIGYDVLKTSTISGDGLENLKSRIDTGVTLFSGHSGVGKSTLLNSLDSSLNVKTDIISEAHSKGKHTTTFAEMYKTSFGAKIIDTPGIKELGLVDIRKNELKFYFPEFKALNLQCKFHDCIHLNEPNCAVLGKMKNDPNSIERYQSYLKMLEECI